MSGFYDVLKTTIGTKRTTKQERAWLREMYSILIQVCLSFEKMTYKCQTFWDSIVFGFILSLSLLAECNNFFLKGGMRVGLQ